MYEDISSKKASPKVIKLVQHIKPEMTKLTKWHEAFEVLADYAKLEIEIKMQIGTGKTELIVYKNKKEAMVLDWPNKDVFKEGDFDWTIMFKDTINALLKKKVIPKPRGFKYSA